MNKYQAYVFHCLYGDYSYDQLVSVLRKVSRCRSYETALNKAEKLLQLI